MFTISSNQNYFQLKSENSSLFWSNLIKLEDIEQPNAVYLCSDKSTNFYWSSHKSLINNVGQYSQQSFEIDSFNSGSNKLVFKVKHDSLNLVLIDNLENEAQILEKIGESEILIIKIGDQNIDKLMSISQNSNAKLVIILVDKNQTDKIKQLFTQNLTEIENGYKIRSKDITGETTQYFILN